MERTLISVTWNNGRWQVVESGPRNSISCFGERCDAMEYATGLAKRTRDSTLLLHKRQLDYCGDREAERNGFSLDRNLLAARNGRPRRRLTVRS